MPPYLRLCYFLFFPLAFSGCGEPEPGPEEVLRTYVRLVNQGELHAAKQWCTPAGVAHLEALETIMAAAEAPLDSTAVQVEVLQCQESTAGLRCAVQIFDGFGPHTESYDLVASAAGWRVDQAGATGATETHEELMTVEQDSLE